MITIEKISELLDGMIINNNISNVNILGINTLEWANPEDISWSFTKEDKEKELVTQAEVIITRPFFSMNYKKIYIFTEKPFDEIMYLLLNINFNKNTIKKNKNIYEKGVELHPQNYITNYNVFIGANTKIGPGVVIEENVEIGKNCVIKANSVIKSGSKICNNVKIDSGAIIGNESFYVLNIEGNLYEISGKKGVEIEENVFIGANTTIGKGIFRKTCIGKNSKIGSLVAIGHDVTIGNNCRIVSQAGIASKTTIGNNVQILAQAGIANDLLIGDDAIIFAKSGVKNNIDDGERVSGIPACNHIKNMKSIVFSRRRLK